MLLIIAMTTWYTVYDVIGREEGKQKKQYYLRAKENRNPKSSQFFNEHLGKEGSDEKRTDGNKNGNRPIYITLSDIECENKEIGCLCVCKNTPLEKIGIGTHESAGEHQKHKCMIAVTGRDLIFHTYQYS